MNGIIIYKSRYGSTRQYAEWVREATGFALYEVRQAPRDLRAYDTVVIGSSVFAGHVALAKWIVAHWPALQGKRVVLMLVNVTADPEEVAKFVPQSLPPEIASQLKVFPVGGRYQLERMSFLDRTMIKMVASLEKQPEKKQELLIERDWVKRENLRELLGYLSEP